MVENLEKRWKELRNSATVEKDQAKLARLFSDIEKRRWLAEFIRGAI